MESGTLSGRIAAGAEPVDNSVLDIEKENAPYAWTLTPDGSYDVELPAGDYTVYAMAQGYSGSAPQQVAIAGGGSETLDFDDVEAPCTLAFAVTDSGGAPLDARIETAEGQAPLVEFLGRRTFFTELDAVGESEASLAPGDYVFAVGHGRGS